MSQARWHDWGRRLAAIAQTGLHYATGFDVDRYADIRRIAAEILAAGGGDEHLIEHRLAQEGGYATPKVDVRGVVIRQGKVLLVREAADGGWTLPGGWADVTDGPRASVEREVAEEAGLDVVAGKLLAVFDRDRRPAPPLPFRIYKLVVQCEEREVAGIPRADGVETLDVGWFDPRVPPALSAGRTHEEHLRIIAEHLDDPARPTDVD